MSPPDPPCTHPEYVGIGLDWLTSIVTAEPREVVNQLTRATGLEPRTSRPLRGYGYPSCIGLYGGDDPELYIMHGVNVNPCVVGPGRYAEGAQAVLANRFPHRCTASRKDVAVDFGDADYFEILTTTAISIANRRQVGLNNMGDWFVPGAPKGRTLYVGSRTSECYIRIYEYRKLHGHGPSVRAELEFKPKTEDKRWCFVATHREILGRSPVMTELLAQVGVDLERSIPRLTSDAPSSLERQTMALLAQYGKLLRDRLLPTLDGDLSELGPYLMRQLEVLESHRASVRQAAAVAHATVPTETAEPR